MKEEYKENEDERKKVWKKLNYLTREVVKKRLCELIKCCPEGIETEREATVYSVRDEIRDEINWVNRDIEFFLEYVRLRYSMFNKALRFLAPSFDCKPIKKHFAGLKDRIYSETAYPDEDYLSADDYDECLDKIMEDLEKGFIQIEKGEWPKI